MTHAPRRRPSLEVLESRDLPATFGVPWPDPQALTLSLIPDGTAIAGSRSSLDQTLNAAMPTTAWEMDILRAYQTWADLGNINIGLVADSGQASGTPGPLQGNARIGDIRVGAVPLGTGTLAITTPFDLGDNLSGDLLLNSQASFSDAPNAVENLATTLLHEAGHSFGLPDNPADPTSAMYPVNTGAITNPSAADIAALQALYGTRAPDTRDDSTFATARPLAPGALVSVDLPTLADQDVYRIIDNTPGPFVVDLRTSGISLLTARETIDNAQGQPIASVAAADPLHGDLSLTIPGAQVGSTYFIRVQAARPDVFGIGTYRLAAGPASLALKALAAKSTLGINPGKTGSTINLTPQTSGTDARWPYLVAETLSNPKATQDYAITTRSTPSAALIVTVWADRSGALIPRVRVFDANHHAVAFQVVAADASSQSIQVLSPVANARYIVEVSAAPGSTVKGALGQYTLGITDRLAAVADETLASGTLNAAQNKTFLSLDLAVAEVYHLDLSGGTSSKTGVSLTVFNARNKVVATLRANGASGRSSLDLVLPAGHYTLAILGASRNGSPPPTIPYLLRGTYRSEPDDPSLSDPTLDPFSLAPSLTPDFSPYDLVVAPFSIFDDFLILASPFSPILWD